MRRRVVPSRFGARIPQIGAREPDIREHMIIEAGQYFHVAPMPPYRREPLDPR
jgi:hypothetical protein